MTTRLLLFLFLFMSYTGYPQNDTIVGPVQSVREQLLFTKTFRKKEREAYKSGKTSSRQSGMRRYGEHIFWHPESRYNLYADDWYEDIDISYINYYRECTKEGKRSKEIWYYDDKDISTHHEYTYNTDGNKIQIKDIRDDHYMGIHYSYDKNDTLRASIRYSSDSPKHFFYNEYIYDNKGNLTHIKKYDKGGESAGTIYEYDNQNRRIKTFSHFPYVYPKWVRELPKDTLLLWHIRGKMNLLKQRDTVGITNLEEEYAWDDKNRKIELKEYDSSKRHIKREYEDDLLLSVKVSFRGELSSIHTYEYDKQKRIVKETTVNPDNPENDEVIRFFYNPKGGLAKKVYKTETEINTIEFLYTYDTLGNWIKQTKSVNGEELYVRKRTIKYYKD